MSKLRIYGVAKSRTFRTLWTAMEVGIDYEHVTVGFDAQGTQSNWFRRINPNAVVPAIQEGDFTLCESLAINLYLAKRYGKGLYPATIEDEARTWQWTLWAATEVERHVVTVLAQRLFVAPEKRSQAAIDDALGALPRPLGVLDRTLAGPPHLLGDRFTIADLNVAGVLYAAYVNQYAVQDHPNVMAWLGRCFERPAAKEARRLREAD